MCSGFHSISAIFLIACAANFGRCDIEENVGAGRFELDDVVIDRGLRGLEASSATIIELALAPRPSFRPLT